MRFAVCLLATFLFPAATNAGYNPTCTERSELVGALAQTHGEVPIGLGASVTRQALEIFTSAKGETWSAVVHNPDGTSCIIAHGENWRALPQELPGAI